MVTKSAKKGNGNAIFFIFLAQKVKNLFSEIFFENTPLPSKTLRTTFFITKRAGRKSQSHPSHMSSYHFISNEIKVK